MKRVLVVVALCAAACTSPNPRSCVDGTCTDPAFPFCDVDGSFFGEEKTCYPVTCTPEEHFDCRGDTSYFCNAAGNDLEQRQCANGCDNAVGGCIPAKRCSMNADCANPTPFCEAQECRACRADDECESTVCDRDTGACVAGAAILYASPTGADAGNCTLAGPCTTSRAITAAGTSGLGKLVRMLPGSYSEPLLIQGNTIVKIVATGATLSTSTNDLELLRVIGGATAEIRGLTAETSATTGGIITCGDQSPAVAKSSLTFVDGHLKKTGAASNVRVFRCNLRIARTRIESSAAAINVGTDATVDADRLHISPAPRGPYSMTRITSLGERMSVRVTNSLFEDAYLSNLGSDTVAPGSNVFAAFNTFLFVNQGVTMVCESNSYIRQEVYENNIFFAQGNGYANVVYQPNGCTFRNNIIHPQPSIIVNNRDMDPKFVDFAAGNYKLQADSPAIDTAVPSAELSTTHDHDGVMRPQGAGYDIGAFERSP